MKETKYSTIIIEQKKSNGLGVSGFILSLIGLIFGLIHPIAIISLFIGFILSFIGLFRKPRGFAIAGFLIGLISILVIIAFAYGVFYLIEGTEFEDLFF